MRSARSPSAASTIGPISPSPSGPTSTAAAPSPNSAAVFGSSKSVMRVSASAPITSTRSARPVSTWPAARRSAASQPEQAAPMSIAPALWAPSAAATTGAAFGVSSSGVIVATSTRSTSRGSTPASWSARRPANVAYSASVSCGAARRRDLIPVRFWIQASSTPMRGAMSEFGTTSGGTWWPSPTMRAVRGGAGATTPVRVASRAIVARSAGSSALRMCKLLSRRLDRAVGEDALAEAGEHLAGPDLDEAAAAGLVQREDGLAPADRLGQRGRELGADVLERLGRGAGEDGERAVVQLGLVERGAERLDRGLHARRVEGAGDVERQRALAAPARGPLGLGEVRARAGEDDLAGRVVVGDGDAGGRGDHLGVLLVGADEGQHRAGVVGLGHQLAAQDDEPQRVVAFEHAGRGERGELAERVAGARRS